MIIISRISLIRNVAFWLQPYHLFEPCLDISLPIMFVMEEFALDTKTAETSGNASLSHFVSVLQLIVSASLT